MSGDYYMLDMNESPQHAKIVQRIFQRSFVSREWCLLDRLRLRLASSQIKDLLGNTMHKFIVQPRHVLKLDSILARFPKLQIVDISALRNTVKIRMAVKIIENQLKYLKKINISYNQFELMSHLKEQTLEKIEIELAEPLILNQDHIPQECLHLAEQKRVKWGLDCQIRPSLTKEARDWLLQNKNYIQKVRCRGSEIESLVAHLLRDNDFVLTGEFENFKSDDLDAQLRVIIESLPSSEWLVQDEAEFNLACKISNAERLHLQGFIPQDHSIQKMQQLKYVKFDHGQKTHQVQELVVALEECPRLQNLDISLDGEDGIDGLANLRSLTRLTVRFINHYKVRPNLDFLSNLQIKELELYHTRGLQIEDLNFLQEYPYLEILRIHLDTLQLYRNSEKGIKFDFSRLDPLIWWSFRKLQIVMVKESMEDMHETVQKSIVEYVSQMIKELIRYLDCPYAMYLQVDCIDMRTLTQVDLSFSIKYI
eukprot:TRINITY_DN23750_c0_g1_i2.p1 TRINITY_DN23750_c0_g1~~TRINITY_DN23750_c0_g1_i2.p1  ORF type:complete len:530 (-),score=41.53 TRINITY_DN23750_c0_g1_i2:379-1818(-)